MMVRSSLLVNVGWIRLTRMKVEAKRITEAPTKAPRSVKTDASFGVQPAIEDPMG